MKPSPTLSKMTASAGKFAAALPAAMIVLGVLAAAPAVAQPSTEPDNGKVSRNTAVYHQMRSPVLGSAPTDPCTTIR